MTTFQKLKHEARRAEQRSDWRKAIALYREALRYDERQGGPDELGLYNRIGDLHIRLGEIDAAVECYETAADRYADNHLPTSAVALCNKILRVAPDRADVFRRLSALHARTGLLSEARSAMLQYVDRMESGDDLSEALEAVQSFVDRTGDEETRLLVADLLAERGRAAQAVAQLRLAMAAAAEREEDTSGLEARIREIESPIGETASIDEPEPARPVGLGTTERGRIRFAERLAERFEETDSPLAGWEAAARSGTSTTLPQADDAIAEALAEFGSALQAELSGERPQLNYDLGMAFQAMGLGEEAVQQFRLAMADPLLRQRAHERIGTILLRSAGVAAPVDEQAPVPEGPTEEQIEEPFFRARLAQYQIRRAEQAGGKDYRSHLDLGAAYVDMGLIVEAARELIEATAGEANVAERAVELLVQLARDPSTEIGAAIDILEQLRSVGREDTAREIEDLLHDRREADRPRQDHLPALGDRSAESETGTPESMVAGCESEEDGSVRMGDPPIEQNFEEASALVTEAQAKLAEGRDEDAKEGLLRALEIYENARDFGESIFVLDLLLGIRPDDPVLHHQRVELALGLDDRETLIESYMGLAASLVRQDAPDDARTVYARVLDIDPEHAEARERMTALRDRPVDPDGSGVPVDSAPESRTADSTEFDALLTDLRRPVQDEVGFEGDTQAHFELGVAFKQMEMWDEAVAELEQAAEGRDDPRPVLEALAECHARSGSADKALSVLLDAEEHPANRASPSPSIAYRIARLNEQAGDHSKAVEWLLQVVAIDPDYRDAASRLSTLSG